jgi:hypothetical protein
MEYPLGKFEFSLEQGVGISWNSGEIVDVALVVLKEKQQMSKNVNTKTGKLHFIKSSVKFWNFRFSATIEAWESLRNM